MWVYVLQVLAGAHRGKKTLDPQELVLQVDVSHHAKAKNITLVFLRQGLLITEIFMDS